MENPLKNSIILYTEIVHRKMKKSEFKRKKTFNILYTCIFKIKGNFKADFFVCPNVYGLETMFTSRGDTLEKYLFIFLIFKLKL